MLFTILKKDYQRNKTITIVLFVFVMMSALLASSGTNSILQLLNSLDNLFTVSNASHFVQMHSGEIDTHALNTFVSNSDLIKSQQTSTMLVIEGSNIYFGDSQTGDESSVMDNGFVTQNKDFDFLLNLENEKIEVSSSEIAVPIYYMQQKNLKIGDHIRISGTTSDMVFTITDFVRDVLMNPSIISSKRFVVSSDDLDTLKGMTGKIEYMIEFQLNDLSQMNEFTTAYQASDLPGKGPVIDYSLFQMLNALTDGVVVAVIFLVSILLILIAVLCLRFTILTTLEEDYKEIGVMKSMGIRSWDIKKIYLTKYIVMGVLACACGYLLSLFTSELFTSNITLYIGAAPRSALQMVYPALAAGFVFMIVLFFCIIILRRFDKISAVEALRFGTIGENNSTKGMPLYKSKILSINLLLGIKDVYGRFSMYLLLFFIYLICSFLIIVSINFSNTIQSPSFVSYMGVGQSDIRIDLQQSEDISERFLKIQEYLGEDADIDKFAPLVTYKYSVVGSENALESINVETGDFSIFPVEYMTGTAPLYENDIALSSLNADSLEKSVGDTLTLVVGGQSLSMTVSGIYQDVTNGGKTAKALLPYNSDYDVLWYTINADIKQGVNINEKTADYIERFHGAKVTYLEDYLSQTLGSTIEQIKRVTLLAVVIAFFISILITSLFLKMLVAKDSLGIAIMKSLGFTVSDIRKQYVARTLLVLVIGIILGTIVANTLGQSLVGIFMSTVGASRIRFVINPIVSYVLCPVILSLIVTITTIISTLSMKKYTIASRIIE